MNKATRPYQHCLLPAAVNLLLGVASASAAEITLYGAADGGINYIHTSLNGNTSSQIGLTSGVLADSMFGLKGKEKLTDKWALTFNLASEVELFNGTLAYSEFFGIESTLGITHHDWGSLKLGRQQTASTNFFTNIDPMGLSFGQANMGTSFTAINTQIYNNLVQFSSANWAGWQFSAGYSFDTGETALYEGSGASTPIPSDTGFSTSSKMRALTSAVQYQHGPLLLAASYDKAYPTSTIGEGPNPVTATPQAWYFGMVYRVVKSLSLSAAWGRGINGAFSGSGPGNNVSGSPLPSITGNGGMLFDQGFNQNSYLLGLSWQLDNRTTWMGSWQMLKPTGELSKTPGIGTQQIVGTALTHNLSPRTTVYVWASYGNNFEMVSGAKASVIGAGIATYF